MCQQQPHSPQALEVDGSIQQMVEVASGSGKGWTAAFQDESHQLSPVSLNKQR